MSLIVYGQKISDDDTQSIVLQDPGSRSLVVMNKESGEISLLRQIRGPHKDTGGKRDARLISSYFCPQCGSEIGTGFDLASVEQAPGQGTGSFVHENYFKLAFGAQKFSNAATKHRATLGYSVEFVHSWLLPAIFQGTFAARKWCARFCIQG